jgi:beta-xylosidase
MRNKPLLMYIAFPVIAIFLSSVTSGISAQTLKMKDHIITNIYTADPSAHVFDGKLYIYPSHDLDKNKEYEGNGDQYDMEDYHVFSIDETFSKVTDHGEVLNMKDVPWVSKQMWAPDAAYNNKKYYLYFPAKDKSDVFRIGVAIGNSPSGPFKALPEPIQGSFSIDPAVFVDDDGKAYMFFGGLWGGQLEKWRTGTYIPDGRGPSDSDPAIGPRVALLKNNMTEFDGPLREIIILDKKGKPLRAGDQGERFFEGSWVHKYNGIYYLSYSTGNTHLLVYATSKNILGPYTYRGVLLEPVTGWTTHHSIVNFKSKWYLFYHDSSRSSGKDHLRSIKYTELFYNSDGTIKTINPFQ